MNKDPLNEFLSLLDKKYGGFGVMLALVLLGTCAILLLFGLFVAIWFKPMIAGPIPFLAFGLLALSVYKGNGDE